MYDVWLVDARPAANAVNQYHMHRRSPKNSDIMDDSQQEGGGPTEEAGYRVGDERSGGTSGNFSQSASNGR